MSFAVHLKHLKSTILQEKNEIKNKKVKVKIYMKS